MNQLVYKPLRELTQGDEFLDEFANTYFITKKEADNSYGIEFQRVNTSMRQFIGVIKEGRYTKYEQEKHRFHKEDAWTINLAILKRAEEIVYYTDRRTYTILASEALRIGSKLALQGEDKVVVPIKYWTATSVDPLENRRTNLLGTEWVDRLGDEMNQDYFKQLARRINHERERNVVYPAPEDVFKAFKLTNYSDVMVVVCGQDSYPAPYANGLAFGVNDKTDKIPYSLARLFEELDRGATAKGFLPDTHDESLESWAKQGVLLLNANLTVGDRPGSHNNFGWETFMKRVFTELNKIPVPVVFLFWGRKAHDTYAPFIDQNFHYTLTAPHPAASAYPDYRGAGFVGCNHFELTNQFLKKTYGREIKW